MGDGVSIFTAADWATLAEIHDLFLTDTCRVRPSVAATPGAHGADQSWPSISVTVSCAVLKQSPISAGGEGPEATWLPNGHTLVVPFGTTLAEGYHVEWVEGGKTLDVVGTPRTRGTDATAVEADCVEVP